MFGVFSSAPPCFDPVHRKYEKLHQLAIHHLKFNIPEVTRRVRKPLSSCWFNAATAADAVTDPIYVRDINPIGREPFDQTKACQIP